VYLILSADIVGLVGLAISYSLAVTNQLSGLVISFTETEKEMVSVERNSQYISGIPREEEEEELEHHQSTIKVR